MDPEGDDRAVVALPNADLGPIFQPAGTTEECSVQKQNPVVG